MPVAPDVQLAGNFDSIIGIPGPPPAPGAFIGQVTIELCGYGSQVPRVPSQGMMARVTDAPLVTEPGSFIAWLYNNTLIEPPGTYYTVTIKDENGDIVQVNAYRFTAPGYYDLTLQIPYDPNQPPPALPPLITNLLLIIPAANDMVFDGTDFTSFKTTLNTDVLGPTIQNMIPGNLYTFIIAQDGAGQHLFTWPTGVHNATRIMPNAGGITVQTFIADENEQLWAIGPGTWSL